VTAVAHQPHGDSGGGSSHTAQLRKQRRSTAGPSPGAAAAVLAQLVKASPTRRTGFSRQHECDHVRHLHRPPVFPCLALWMFEVEGRVMC